MRINAVVTLRELSLKSVFEFDAICGRNGDLTVKFVVQRAIYSPIESKWLDSSKRFRDSHPIGGGNTI
jgi:hypothetical protein